jgi:uncharacterized protein YndB with AHSA1/START domain
MTDRSIAHGSFSIEREYPAPPERVFAAWSRQAEKNRWFGEGDDFLASTDEYTLDFRVGGHERLAGTMPGGRSFTYDAFYQEIVDNRRLVASYDVAINGRRQSVSLLSVELLPTPGGTMVVLTEQGAFFDGLDSNDQRQEGAADSLDKLGQFLAAGAQVA